MIDWFFNMLQLLGGILLTVGYVPQIAQIIKTKSVDDLNGFFLMLVFGGVFCMECYAIHIYPEGKMFLITNTASTICAAVMYILYLSYKSKGE